MPKLDVTIHRQRCQAHGACTKIAPSAFQLDDQRKVQLIDRASVTDDTLLQAARSCPYRAITVVDSETGEQIHPRVRK
jgi:ferredoxin